MPAKRLHRSLADQHLAGVCGGIADYFDVDPVIVRLAVVGITLAAPPVGIIGYIVCWVVIPEEPVGDTPESRAPVNAGTASEAATSPPAASGAENTPGAVPPPAKASGEDRSGLVGGTILVAVGLVFLTANLDLFDWGFLRYVRWRYLWPVIVIGIGLWLITSSMRSPDRDRRRSRQRDAPDRDHV